MKLPPSLLCVSILALAPSTTAAQVSPANMVSAVDSVLKSGVVQTKQFFTVPAGQRFVLTDFVATDLNGSAVHGIVDDTNTLRWFPMNLYSTSTLNKNHFSLQTGIVFEPGHSVGLRVGIGSGEWVRFSWSGYLAPIATSAVPNDNGRQLGFSLSPNPVRQVVTLTFELARSANIDLGIYDAQGRLVRTVASGRFGMGTFVETWDGRTEAGASAPSGVYFARLESSEASSVRRLVRIR